MHSDSWVEVPFQQCPPHVQENTRVIGRMDAFLAAAEANKDALETYVEALFRGESSVKPKPVFIPPINDPGMEYMMERNVSDAAHIAQLMLGADVLAIIYLLDEWQTTLRRKTEYLVYNRKALEKRYRKGADQKEIDRVKKLITDGEEEIAFLQPRIAWARSKVL